MGTDNNIWQIAEDYISGEMSDAERLEVDGQLKTNPAFANSFYECVNLLNAIVDGGRQQQFRSMLGEIDKNFNSIADANNEEPAKTIPLRSHYWRTAAVAAGVAVATSIGISFTMHQKSVKTASFYRELAKHQRDINSIKNKQAQQDMVINEIQDSLKHGAPSLDVFSTGTGFALSNDGYLVTNYHVVNGADSVYIRTSKGDYYKAYTAAYDAQSDIAILRIEAANFRFSKGELPYKLNAQPSKLAERIYTLGFPQENLVYNEGYLSSQAGFEGNANQYLLELPSSPGQSGAPVMDAAGNIIGIVTANETDKPTTTYAVSVEALQQLIHSVPKQMNIRLPKNNRLEWLSREKQVEKMKEYTCMVQVYKNS